MPIDINQGYTILKPMILFVLGVVIYSMFIFKFYRFLGKMDIFELNLKKYNTSKNAGMKKFMSIIFYMLEYIILFPLFVFFWFLIIPILFQRTLVFPHTSHPA